MIAELSIVECVSYFFIITLIISYTILRVREHRSIQRLGGYAPHVDGWLPFSESERLCYFIALSDL